MVDILHCHTEFLSTLCIYINIYKRIFFLFLNIFIYSLFIFFFTLFTIYLYFYLLLRVPGCIPYKKRRGKAPPLHPVAIRQTSSTNSYKSY